ncbi:MAG: Smr/MutS family protein, partial [Bacteroidales bacterium]|nr:Smr/MutS family protein [Bacteroidales bacterium]
AEPKATKKLREDLKEKIVAQEVEIKTLEKEIKNSPFKEAPPKTHIPLDSSALQEGDIVLIDGQDSYGEVLKLKKGKADVVCGLLNMSLPISRLKKVNKDSYLRQQKQQKNVNRQSCTSLMEDINNLRQSFSYRLDLRGKRADEALSALSKYIDTARLLGESELSVLHGKGDGVLKTVLRDYLKQCPDVESYKAERVEFGGEGITKIKLK